MPDNSPAIFFGQVPLVEGGPDPGKSSSSYQIFETWLHSDPSVQIEGVTKESLPGLLHHYVQPGPSAPLQDYLAEAGGTFETTEENGQVCLKMNTFSISLLVVLGLLYWLR